MRCFVAVDLDPSLMGKITELQSQLKGFDTKLVEPENMHFTLKFLGEVDMKTAGEVNGLLEQVAAKFDPFELAVENTGVFPSEKFLRVIWLGGESLINLQLSIEEGLAPLFKAEKPVPHLTLARIRSQKYSRELLAFIRSHEKVKIGTMKVDAIRLKESVLSRNGPVYRDIRVFELGS